MRSRRIYHDVLSERLGPARRVQVHRTLAGRTAAAYGRRPALLGLHNTAMSVITRIFLDHGTASGWKVSGATTVHNPNGSPSRMSVSDRVDRRR